MSTIKLWSNSIAILCVAASIGLMSMSLALSWETFSFISLSFAVYAVVFAVFGLIAVLAGKRDS